MENERLLTAGEFAGITGVTKHTLFHYDDIGLFCPEKKDTKGYRYYSFAQLEVFDVIAALKDLDMPLREIKKYMDERSPDKLLKLLEKESLIALEKEKRLRSTRDWIVKKKKIIREAMAVDTNRIYMREAAPSCAAAVRLNQGDERTWAMDTGRLIEVCKALGIRGTYGIGYRQPLAGVIERGPNNYELAYVVTDKKLPAQVCCLIPGGTYLTGYHRGLWQELPVTYEKMFAFAREKGIRLSDDCYVDSLLNELTQKSENEHTIRVSFSTT